MRRAVKAQAAAQQFSHYQRDLFGYAREYAGGFVPWEAEDGSDSQASLFRAIQESVNAQLDGRRARHAFSIKSCHGVGKSYSAAVLVNWFFDSFPDSIIMTSAPTSDQLNKLLWKDIRKTRHKDGQQHLQPSAPFMSRGPAWFAMGRTTSNNGGKGSARMHGQHAKFMLFVFDEADGVPEFAYGAVDGMMTSLAPGQVLIFLRIGNPQSRDSEFHRRHANTRTTLALQFDALRFPNVVTGENIVPGGTTRQWVSEQIARHCTVTAIHDPDLFTFALDWDTVQIGEESHPVVDMHGKPIPAGTPILPSSEFLWRVRGITPPTSTTDTLISEGRYLAALSNTPEPTESDWLNVQIGVDCARYGDDNGTFYLKQAGRITRTATLSGADTHAYVAEAERVMQLATKQARAAGVRGPLNFSFRVDVGGGYGAGPADGIKTLDAPEDGNVVVHQVHFNGATPNPDIYDLITAIYEDVNVQLLDVRVDCDTPELRDDLTGRRFGFSLRGGRNTKKLEQKREFKKRFKRSPDDGDGFVLCAASEMLFRPDRPVIGRMRFNGYA